MLWLCIHLPALPLEALSPPPDEPLAVVETSGARRLVLVPNEVARERGLRAGTPVNSALALIPELRLLPRDPGAELQALQGIACWAYHLGTPVTMDADAFNVEVEIRRSLRLFGGWPALRRHIAGEVAALPYARRYGVAPTLSAAALLARTDAGLERPIARSGEIHAAIRNWPLQLLPLEHDALDILHGSGLRRIGEVLALPRDALGRRFGLQAPLALERLLGRAAEAWESFEPPPIYRRRLELHGSAETTGALLFPLRKMLGDFAFYLRARDLAVQRFRLGFRDLGRRLTQLDLGLLAPTRDPDRLLLVLRERLEKISLTEPVQELLLEAKRFEPADAAQDDLFQNGTQLAEDFATLQERLLARLGEAAVRHVAATPDHRPERAWRTSAEPSTGAHPPRPPWLLPQPRPIPPPRLLGPPERIECGWWEGRHEVRDYHLAEDESGRKLWVYRELGGARWHLHGLWQ
ncbi:MAG: DNA polymerase Y family protein [Nevskia sp.]|nr:DNA polymerase Y family protein [Nevskia sp.]